MTQRRTNNEFKISIVSLHGLFNKVKSTFGYYQLRADCCFKTLLQQGISDPVFYSDLVYKPKIIIRKPSLSDQFKKILNAIKEWDIPWILSRLIVGMFTVCLQW